MTLNTSDYKTLEIKYVGERDTSDILSYGELCKYGKHYIISCPRCGGLAMLQTKKRLLAKYHKIISFIPLAIDNSIICPYCKAHYYIKKGKVVII